MRTPPVLRLAALLLAAATASHAQGLRLRGTIERADGAQLAVRLADGSTGTLVLLPGATVIAVEKASFADIREGTYLGSAAVPQGGGLPRALEVHIFPEEMRGTGEGHRPYAPVPDATMTNGAIARAAAAGGDGLEMTLRYAGGEQRIAVGADVPVVRFAAGSAADLKPGARFATAAAAARPEGGWQASRINVGREGAVPP